MITNEEKTKLKKFVQDPDWKIMEKLIMDYISPFKHIDNLDLTQNATAIKGEIRVRKQAYDNLVGYLSEMTVLRDEFLREHSDNPFE